MSINDFENIPDSDDAIVSKIGSAVRAAMTAKENLQHSIAEAVDSSTDFGYALGAEDMKIKISKAFEAEGGINSEWAIKIISRIF